MARVFSTINLYPLIKGGSQLQWKLHPYFNATAPYSFQVQTSRSGVSGADDWVNLGSPQVAAGIEGTWTLTDNSQRVWSTADRFWYRIALTDAEDNVYHSEPVFFMGTLHRKDWLLVRELLRKENLRLRYVGQCGTLYKRRYWGTRCPYPHCIDHSTQDVTNSNCPVCFGTGWQGGYYAGLTYPLDISDATPRTIKTLDGAGLTGQMIVRARATPCPQPRTNDLWVGDDNIHYFVDSVTSAASIRGFDVVLTLVLREAQPGDIAYHVTDDEIESALSYAPEE